MFVDFFYTLRSAGVPASTTGFLTLLKALDLGLVTDLDDFYTAARTILVKSERHFDLFDRVFAHRFEEADLPEMHAFEPTEMARALLEDWLRDPEALASILGFDASEVSRLTPEDLIEYFSKRLKEQQGPHHGGHRWIGTRGKSPVGHSGHHPEGLRVGGKSTNRSAVKVALERRYKEYSHTGLLTRPMIGEALKRLRHLIPVGPRDRLDIDATLYQTVKAAGDITIVFKRSLKDRLKVILAVDNGGWSMEPYIPVVQCLFDYARAQFKDLQIYYFHNTIYDQLWKDPSRIRLPYRVADFSRQDPDTRLILVGDASMAPYELMATEGSIHIEERSTVPSLERLRFLAGAFPCAAWLNPVPEYRWPHTRTIQMIQAIFPMFPLTLDGLEQAVSCLMGNRPWARCP